MKAVSMSGLAFTTFIFCFSANEGRQVNLEIRDYKREVNSLDANTIYAALVQTVGRVNNGDVQAADVKSVTQQVKSSISQLVTVSQEDATKEILEAATKLNLQPEAEALLNNAQNGLDPIESNVKNLEVALQLWQAVAEKGETLQGADNSGVLSAISVLSDLIETALNTVADNLSELIQGRDTSNSAANHLIRSSSKDLHKRGGHIGFSLGSIRVKISW